jgi:hypothetical protein
MTINLRPIEETKMNSFEPTEKDFESVYGSKFLSAGEIVAVGSKKRAKIAKVDMADLRQDGSSGTRRRFILFFEGVDKGMVLNQTNASALKDALGKNPTKWVGADVVLTVEQVAFGNKRVPGLRLRVLAKPVGPAATPTAPVKPAPAEVDPDINSDPGWAPDSNWERDSDFVTAAK